MALFDQEAVKERLLARVAIEGPTGSGKTWTALQWGRILVGPSGLIGVADTENRSAAYYAPEPGQKIERVNFWDPPYEFRHLPIQPPYDPRQLAEIIKVAGDELMNGDQPGVLIIDSGTHFWNGEGGTLDIVDHAAQRSGNTFTGWKEGTPAQRHLLDTIVHAKCHVIFTMRSKMEHILEEDSRGKKVPKKVGMQPEQRAGIEYEFTIVADMDLEHRLVITKSRCDRIADAVATKGRSAEVAQAFAEWLATGPSRITEEEAAELLAPFATIEDQEVRTAVKVAFVQEFGRPGDLFAGSEAYEAAKKWVAERFPVPDVQQPAARQRPRTASVLAEAVKETSEAPEAVTA